MTKTEKTRAILIVGATGRIGSALTTYLLSRFPNYKIVILVRNRLKAERLWESDIAQGRVKVCLTTNLGAKDIFKALDGVDIAVWCAGPRSAFSLSNMFGLASSPDTSKSVDYYGIRNLVEAIKTSPTLQRVIMVSPPEVARPMLPSTIYKNLMNNGIFYWKELGEHLVKESGIDYTIIRPHNVTQGDDKASNAPSEVSFHQHPLPLWKSNKIELGILAGIISEAIERPEKTTRSTFEISGKTSGAEAWDDLFDKLRPDNDISSRAIKRRHHHGVGIAIGLGVLAAATTGIAIEGYKRFGGGEGDTRKIR